jgi:hypothetical protein
VQTLLVVQVGHLLFADSHCACHPLRIYLLDFTGSRSANISTLSSRRSDINRFSDNDRRSARMDRTRIVSRADLRRPGPGELAEPNSSRAVLAYARRPFAYRPQPDDRQTHRASARPRPLTSAR